MKHANIALFVPHLGCPHQCSFCNQTRITGVAQRPTAQTVHQAVQTALASGRMDPAHTEIAFFGGSFTAMEPWYQESLLQAAYAYVQQGVVRGIRISTRPDAVDPIVLKRMQQYGVTAIELGAQSMEDRVLALNHRGHTAQQTVESSRRIREAGIALGLQMMVGLYGDSEAGAEATARALIALSPDTMRIYPTLVLEGTPLAHWYRAGDYVPLTLEQAVSLCSRLLDLFEVHQIPVIRLGLHDSPAVQACLAGPYHPAFAELCAGERFLRKLTAFLKAEQVPKGELQIAVPPKELSQAIGQKKRNVLALEQQGYRCRFVTDASLRPGTFSLTEDASGASNQ